MRSNSPHRDFVKDALGISDRTVQGHLASIYGKLAVASRTEAVTRTLKLGWLVLDDA